jgi:biotin synthase
MACVVAASTRSAIAGRMRFAARRPFHHYTAMPATCDLATDPAAIAELADAVARGHEATTAELCALADAAPGPAQEALFAGARRIRDARVGSALKMCSVINVKAGNCSENCSYCAQASGAASDGYQKTKFLGDEQIAAATSEAAGNGAQAVALVAAWRGVKEGTQLDMVVQSIKAFAAHSRIRPDANLGILESQRCADAIHEAGVAVYGHNLETAKSFFGSICSTHSWEERMRTIAYVKKSGMGLCSGGIFGMGETRAQRVEFLEQVRFVEPQMVPLNFLNPLPGTKLAHLAPLPPDEALSTLAVARFALPDRNLMAAGGKEVVLGERVHEVFRTGINAVMVGNYLTTPGSDPHAWKAAAERWGLRVPDSCGSGSCGSCG